MFSESAGSPRLRAVTGLDGVGIVTVQLDSNSVEWWLSVSRLILERLLVRIAIFSQLFRGKLISAACQAGVFLFSSFYLRACLSSWFPVASWRPFLLSMSTALHPCHSAHAHPSA